MKGIAKDKPRFGKKPKMNNIVSLPAKYPRKNFDRYKIMPAITATEGIKCDLIFL